jgi:hypothetical protein
MTRVKMRASLMQDQSSARYLAMCEFLQEAHQSLLLCQCNKALKGGGFGLTLAVTIPYYLL